MLFFTRMARSHVTDLHHLASVIIDVNFSPFNLLLFKPIQLSWRKLKRIFLRTSNGDTQIKIAQMKVPVSIGYEYRGSTFYISCNAKKKRYYQEPEMVILLYLTWSLPCIN